MTIRTPAFIALLVLLLIPILPQTSFSKESPPACQKHRIELQRARIPIGYGLPSQQMFERLQYEREHFPNANVMLLGGCVIGDKKSQKGYFCEKCRAERAEWMEKETQKKSSVK